MTTKTVGKDENISVGDHVQFVLETYDGSGCLITPYQITSATIYFVNRDFTDTSAAEYKKDFTDGDLQAEYDSTKQAVCLKARQMVRAASTGPIPLSGIVTVDGIDLSKGDRVLVKDQSDKAENGIYLCSEGPWKRAPDMLDGSVVVSGTYLFVENGISNIGTGWTVNSLEDRVAGEDELDFVLFAREWSPDSPDEKESENIRNLALLKKKLDSSRVSSSFFYKDAVAIKTFGGSLDPVTKEFFPAWLNPDDVPTEDRLKVISDNLLVRAEGDEGELLGKFILEWSTDGVREGDYFICWSWRPTVGDEVLSAHQFFYLGGNDYSTTSIPTHRSKSDKYEMLLERYTPDMFKNRISDSDLSPEVISEFNKAVAKGFTLLENQANATIDLLDSNATHDQLLPVLSNMFNLKIKSNDPTLWRRQIKKAIPNFKKKGSIVGLREALGDAGMSLLRLSRMWQVTPKYTWQEHFVYKGRYADSGVFVGGEGSNEFFLSKTPSSQDPCDFRIWFRDGKKGSEWIELDQHCGSSSSSGRYIEISGDVVTWNLQAMPLKAGDSVRFVYPFRSSSSGEMSKDQYIRSLPLMDDRDERMQSYPPKNWNLHLVEEDDEYFDLLVPVRHPFSDPIVWGRVRTEFPYSENLYNMEEYNGSKRDSFDPCDIDKEFMDSCGQCASSKFNLDVEIEMLSDERFRELRQIVDECMPFHAVPNSFGLWGGINEFVRHSEESVKAMIQFSKEDVTIAGEGQNIFSRSVYQSDVSKVKRNLLASTDPVPSPSTGLELWQGSVKNSRTLLLPRAVNEEDDLENESFKGLTGGFDSYNIKIGEMHTDPFENGNLLEVLGSVTRYYSVSAVDASGATIHGAVDQSMIGNLFEYRLSNLIGDFNVDIQQYEEVLFNDQDTDFSMLGIVSRHDVDSGLAGSGQAWSFVFENKEYVVKNILPDGSLLLEDGSPTTPISGWILKDGSTTKKTGVGGSKTIKNYGLVEVNSSVEVRDIFAPGDFLYLGSGSSVERYRVKSFQKDANKFYIQDYSDGDAGGVDVKAYRRLMDKKIGQFGCDTLVLTANDDLESLADPGQCLVFIDPEYYIISEVDGHEAKLSGPLNSYGNSPTGIQFKIYRFTKENLILSEKQTPPYDEKPPEYEFRQVGRSGEAIITSTQGAEVEAMASLLNSSGTVDIMTQDETIGYEIEYKEKKDA